MKLESGWTRKGMAADARDLAEAGNLARLHRRKAARAEREARQMEAQAKRVGAAVRRDARERHTRYVEWLAVSPKGKSGRTNGQRRLHPFERMTGQGPFSIGHAGADGLSSFHFQWTGRGLRPRKGQSKNYAYRRGEIVRLVKYILREAAREIEGGGIVSSIAEDPDEIASVLGAVEELEMAAGQANANVYISLVISLPHELSAAARERVLIAITEAFRKEGLPFAGVLHRPDAGTDQRNFHAHVVASLRPFRREEDGRYSFAALPSSDLNDGIWIRSLRRRIAEAINEEMAQLAVELDAPQRVFTHLSHAERGLTPKTRAEGKAGPGRKAAEWKAGEMEVAQTELLHEQARLKILDDLTAVVSGLVEHASLDVARILRDARERVSVQTIALAAAAQARELGARIAVLRRVADRHLERSNRFSSHPIRHRVTSLQRAPHLSEVASLGRAPVMTGTSIVPDAITQAGPSDAAPSPPLSNPQDPSHQGHGDGRASLATPKIGRSAASSSHLADALAVAKTLSFLPLRPFRRSGEPLRYAVDLERAAPSDHAAVSLIHQHQRAPEMQRLLARSYEAMRQAVLIELTTRRSDRPKGDARRMFDRDPRLAAAVAASWGHKSLTQVIDHARAYWNERQSFGLLDQVRHDRGVER